MNIENKNINDGSTYSRENFRVEVTNLMLYDRLHILSAEYSVSVELLVNAAVKRLIEDIDFVRNLRTGKTGLAIVICILQSLVFTVIMALILIQPMGIIGVWTAFLFGGSADTAYGSFVYDI